MASASALRGRPISTGHWTPDEMLNSITSVRPDFCSSKVMMGGSAPGRRLDHSLPSKKGGADDFLSLPLTDTPVQLKSRSFIVRPEGTGNEKIRVSLSGL